MKVYDKNVFRLMSTDSYSILFLCLFKNLKLFDPCHLCSIYRHFESVGYNILSADKNDLVYKLLCSSNISKLS